MLTYNKNLKQPSRRLRKSMTDAERRLWMKIRTERIGGYRFYRQKPVGDYIVDFFCPKARLVVEVDGGQHLSGDAAEYDLIRSEYLSSLGVRVLRFTNAEVLRNTDSVVQSIVENLGGKISLDPSFSKRDNHAQDNGSSHFEKGRPRGI